MSTIDNIMYLIDKNVIQFSREFLRTINSSPTEIVYIHGIHCLIKQKTTSIVRQYFVILDDQAGFHCVDWTTSMESLLERVNHWETMLTLRIYDIVEYSFPDVLPIKLYHVKPYETSEKE